MLPASGQATVNEQALTEYARARAADSFGAPAKAGESYAAALALTPDNELLAARALSHALSAGDRALAVEAARALERSGKLAPDGRLMLLVDALRTGKWKAATLQIDRIEKDEVFSFLAPLLRAWVAHGSRKGDPIDILSGLSEDQLASAYAAEHRPLLLLARGRKAEGLSALAVHLEQAGSRAPRLRMAAAALLAKKGDRRAALSLLEGQTGTAAVARRRIEAGKPIGGEIATASQGIAELLLRIAIDLNSQELPQLALSFSRLATFLAPANAETWILTAEFLGRDRRVDEALVALGNVPADSPYSAMAADNRIGLLVEAGRQEDALGAARAAVETNGQVVENWSRLGELLSGMDRHKEAAEAYGKALALAKDGVVSASPLWALWLLHGSELTQSGQWPEARAALEAAYKLAPDQAVVLNYLGYSQLERRENVAEAERLIREASRLQPDDAAITDSLGWAHYVRGDFGKAIELLERAAQGQPSDAAINEHLGDAYYSAGRRYEARYAWRAALIYADSSANDRLRSKIDTGLRPELTAP
jgi:tetratricopeptide (TPR) repeat protein